MQKRSTTSLEIAQYGLRMEDLELIDIVEILVTLRLCMSLPCMHVNMGFTG